MIFYGVHEIFAAFAPRSGRPPFLAEDEPWTPIARLRFSSTPTPPTRTAVPTIEAQQARQRRLGSAMVTQRGRGQLYA
jgi:poly(3-hydroxybutyrate) depolymerase